MVRGGAAWPAVRYVLPFIHVEVVEPKIHEHFLKLSARIQRSINLAFAQIRRDDLLRLTPAHSQPAHIGKFNKGLRRQSRGHLFAFLGIEIAEQSRKLLAIAALSRRHLIRIQEVAELRIYAPL